MGEERSIAELLDQIEDFVRLDPRNLEPVITELHTLINNNDPDITELYPLVKDGFEADRILKNIRELSQRALTVPQIRFKADELSRKKRIPLPNSTRKHKEPLMQWFKIHWRDLVADIEKWKEEPIKGEAGK
jgi:hypothetical protein